MSEDSLWNAYTVIRDKSVVAENPKLDKSKEYHEVLVICKCNQWYITELNGAYHEIHHILDQEEAGVTCPACGRSSIFRKASAQHSGGVFNAIHSRMNI